MEDEGGMIRCQVCRRPDSVVDLLTSSKCSHHMCVECARLFDVQQSTQCRVCQQPLTRKDFRGRTAEDDLVAAEIQKRKRLKDTFNLKRKDFANTPTYEDYRAEVEDIIEMEEPDCTLRVEKFKKDHQHEIALNKARDQHEITNNSGPVFNENPEPTELGLMGPPQTLTRMPTELNRNNPGNVDKATLWRKKTHGGGFFEQVAARTGLAGNQTSVWHLLNRD
eukprot:TRINITY_DN15219_c0_g1_i3.p2 TRINITY_DN15219_c0_g1~~TRINITY_DN15219_c0_g1_i3.p2  ORF type:complete len:222 (+),score=45.22 TRINITY_DN15219_c0_g1_i3:223-888(+)